MNELPNLGLAGWDNFFVIVGSSAGALIGLQFVVLTIISDGRRRTTPASLGAFATPTVVNFAGALLISAIMSAPWPSLFAVSVAIAVCGIPGLAYSAMVIHHARRQKVYQPVWEDWLWYLVLPCCVYAALTLAAFFLRVNTRVGTFVIAGAALALLLIAIHNAWDTVTFIIMADSHEPE
jgi:hypothetical protein